MIIVRNTFSVRPGRMKEAVRFASLADCETRLPQNFTSADWQAWYARFTDLVRGGRREIFRVVD
jgi:hypothetical protein